MQQVSDGAVEVRRIGSLKHHLQVVAILPTSLSAELFLHQLVELRARQRVRHTDSHIIGAGIVE